jgi:hypothetical protein
MIIKNITLSKYRCFGEVFKNMKEKLARREDKAKVKKQTLLWSE